jgi:capsular polysaccharide biosynthesis protein
LLDLVGITADRRVVYDYETDLVSAEVLFIPTMVRQSCRTAPLFKQAVEFARRLIWERHPQPAVTTGRRIFVSRANAKRSEGRRPVRTLMNRADIEAMAERAGFAVVHPETMPLLQQFAMFREAEAVIGEYGSALHSSIFSERQPIVCALQGAGPFATYLQSGIGHALGQPTGYVFGREVDEDRAFRIEPEAFAACLELVFGEVGLA